MEEFKIVLFCILLMLAVAGIYKVITDEQKLNECEVNGNTECEILECKADINNYNYYYKEINNCLLKEIREKGGGL